MHRLNSSRCIQRFEKRISFPMVVWYVQSATLYHGAACKDTRGVELLSVLHANGIAVELHAFNEIVNGMGTMDRLPNIVILDDFTCEQPWVFLKELVKTIRSWGKRIFLCVYSRKNSALYRYNCFECGVSMVTECMDDLVRVCSLVLSKRTGKYTCPFCLLDGLSEDQLWVHCPLYHINEINVTRTCPICAKRPNRPFQVHMRNAHGPPGRGDMHQECDNDNVKVYSFALVVCQHPETKKFLMVQEFANIGYWLPGGKVDAGEDPKDAAIRETLEEAGIHIRLVGLIRMEHIVRNGYLRLRFVFLAEPKVLSQLPKSIPDYESVGAVWCDYHELSDIPLRGNEPIHYFRHVVDGQPVASLDVLKTV